MGPRTQLFRMDLDEEDEAEDNFFPEAAERQTLLPVLAGVLGNAWSAAFTAVRLQVLQLREPSSAVARINRPAGKAHLLHSSWDATLASMRLQIQRWRAPSPARPKTCRPADLFHLLQCPSRWARLRPQPQRPQRHLLQLQQPQQPQQPQDETDVREEGHGEPWQRRLSRQVLSGTDWLLSSYLALQDESHAWWLAVLGRQAWHAAMAFLLAQVLLRRAEAAGERRSVWAGFVRAWLVRSPTLELAGCAAWQLSSSLTLTVAASALRWCLSRIRSSMSASGSVPLPLPLQLLFRGRRT